MEPREPKDPFRPQDRPADHGPGGPRPGDAGDPETRGMRPDPSDPETRVDLSGLRRLSADAPPERPPKRPRDGSLGRMIAFALAAILFAAAPWYFFSRVLGDDAPAAKPPAATKPPSPSPTPTPSPSGTPGTYEVANTEACVRVRAAPGTDQPVLTCLTPGIRVTSDGMTKEADGFVWLHVKYKQFDGWSATNFLQKVG